MHLSLDGFVTVEYGGTNVNWDEQIKKFSMDNLVNVDTLLLGRQTADEIVTSWGEIARQPEHNDHTFGKLLTELPKVVFSNTLKSNKWENATIVSGDIAEQVNDLKNKQGKNILVYGGASFVSSLIENNLIDEYYFLLNPIAFGNGLTIFKSLKHPLRLTLKNSSSFDCGTILLEYVKPKQEIKKAE